MISKDDAIKIITTEFYCCNIHSIIEKDDSFVFNLVDKIGGKPSVSSPVIVNKKNGTWKYLPPEPIEAGEIKDEGLIKFLHSI